MPGEGLGRDCAVFCSVLSRGLSRGFHTPLYPPLAHNFTTVSRICLYAHLTKIHCCGLEESDKSPGWDVDVRGLIPEVGRFGGFKCDAALPVVALCHR